MPQRRAIMVLDIGADGPSRSGTRYRGAFSKWASFVVLLLCCGYAAVCLAWEIPASGTVITVKPSQGSGFAWPYYMYVPPAAREEGARPVHLLVSTNNTGKPTDDFAEHESAALRLLARLSLEAQALGCPSIVPVFPRPGEFDSIYTHALDRDCLTTQIEGLERLDLQLLAMVDDALGRLRERGWEVSDRFLIMGFSASGMFANRFAVLHPDRVLAAAVGSPGGWPIAPVAKWDGQELGYPVGIADLEALTGVEFLLEAYRDVPHFFFIGDKDSNDSVVYRDGYDESDERQVFDLFGETPVTRWPIAEEIYRAAGASAEFRTYAGVGHEISPEMRSDMGEFFRKVLDGEQQDKPE
jgi:pimeloyl-ACP methyl ester carboxylesterase